MTQPAPPDWEEIRRTWETTHEPPKLIAARHGLFHLNIHLRAKREGWAPRPTPETTTAQTCPSDGVVPAPEPPPEAPACVATPATDDPASPPPQPTSPAQAPRPPTPPRRRPRSLLASAAGVQAIIDRLVAAVVKRLSILERQLETIADLDTQATERIDRSLRTIMQNFEKAQSLDAAHKAKRKTRTRGAATSLDAQRHALAERIERFNTQWLARRAAAGVTAEGGPAPGGPGLQPVDGGSPPGATPPAAG